MAGGPFNFFKPRAAKHSPSTTLAETLDKARSLHLQGQHADAQAICREILEREPDHVDALFLSAEIAARRGESDRANRLDSPLFDTRRFTRHLESAYAKILERFHAGLPPEHIHVPP